MPTTVVDTVTELLNEEKWTRATLNSYTIGNFKEMEELIEQTCGDGLQSEISELCSDHLAHTKNSIIALYISGVLSISKQMLNDSNLLSLVGLFADNHKWGLVEYLCTRILDFGENKDALRALADAYESENKTEEKFLAWERLIKVDHTEADIVRSLATRCENNDDIPGATGYYKKAIHRYIIQKSFPQVREIWESLIEHAWEEWEFFFHLDRKIEQHLSSERSSQLLELLYQRYKDEEIWDKAITILKRILNYDPKNQWARTEITECFTKRYEFHSQVTEYIRLSNLTQSWRNVHDAIADFEKHISFDEGNFVLHRAWGIGKIVSIRGDEITIDFMRKRNHSMSLKMAMNALNYLPREHILVLKATNDKESLCEKVRNDFTWALKVIIRSYDNSCSLKQIKAELVPSLFTDKEWISLSGAARKILKNNPDFGNIVDKVDSYMVREKPITMEEKCFVKFKGEKGFFLKYRAMRDFIAVADVESEYFTEIFSFFTNYLRSHSGVDALVISSFLIVDNTVRSFPFLNPNIDISFSSLVVAVEDLGELYSGIEDPDLRQLFLVALKELNNWPELFAHLFPYSHNSFIIQELERHERKEILRHLYSQLLDGYKEYRESFIWIARNSGNESWCEEYGFRYEKILIGMLHLLDITFRDINSRREVGLNRKLNRQIHNWLFKEGKLEQYIREADEVAIGRIYAMIEDVRDLDPNIKIDMKKLVIQRFPDFKFYGKEPPKTVSSKVLYVTESAYKKKQQEYHNLVNVEIPKNSTEIGEAIELGDLSENAEYKAGKEKQELLNISANKMRSELDRAQIFNLDEVTTELVGFGTTVEFLNMDTDKKEQYTILGPWESDPNAGIISYMAPFGAALLNHSAGEELHITINDRDYNLKVLKIEKLQN